MHVLLGAGSLCYCLHALINCELDFVDVWSCGLSSTMRVAGVEEPRRFARVGANKMPVRVTSAR